MPMTASPTVSGDVPSTRMDCPVMANSHSCHRLWLSPRNVEYSPISWNTPGSSATCFASNTSPMDTPAGDPGDHRDGDSRSVDVGVRGSGTLT